MYLSIEKIMFKYNNYYFNSEIEYWFDKELYKFYTKEYVKKLGYTAKTQNELTQILAQNNIIPSFSVNEYEFDKFFIECLRNRTLWETFSRITDEETYDYSFRVYTESNNIDYKDDLHEFYCKAVVKWCIENNIRYKTDSSERKKYYGNPVL